MSRCIALLRAVNVGGRNKVVMAELRALISGLGFAGAQTLLQSGNAVFGAGGKDPGRIEGELEEAASRQLNLKTDFLVRTAAEWRAAIAANPFAAQAEATPGQVLLMALKDAPDKAAAAALQDAIRGRERVAVSGRHAWLHYPDGIGRSKLTGALIEAKLGARGTARNWNTVLKLEALASG